MQSAGQAGEGGAAAGTPPLFSRPGGFDLNTPSPGPGRPPVSPVPVLEKFLISHPPVTIWLAGKPTPQGRARFSRRSGHAYDPQRSRTWKNAAEVIFRRFMDVHGLEPMTGALELHYEAIFAVPKSYSIKKREDALTGLLPYTKSPDLDNLVKIIQDAMNGIIFMDDRQITDLLSSKRYGLEDGVRVTVVECPTLT